jgi:hypothetical protein
MLVESLVLGHLPVMTSAWAAQYVRRCAEGHAAPVAVVRITGGLVRVELHGAPAALAGTDEDAGACECLEDALLLAGRCCARVIVFPESKAEAEAAGASGVTQVTLLTSADESGVVAAYRSLKAMAQALNGRSCHAVVMGAPPDRADFAARRLADACRQFLGLSLSFGEPIPRIGGGPVGRTLFSGPARVPVAEMLTAVRAAAVGPRRRTHPALRATDQPTTPHPSAESAAPPIPDVTAVPVDESALHAAMRGPAARQSLPANPPEAVHSAIPTPAPAVDPHPAATHADSLLAAHIPGLCPMAARCPFADDVELAFDAHGGLHLLAGAVGLTRDQRTIETLTAAAAWAQTNIRVLALTLPEGKRLVPDGVRPTLHLFTDRPAAFRTLLDSPIRVHLLAPIVKVRNADWFCAALN